MQPDALLRPPLPVMQTDRPFLQTGGAFFARAATPEALRRLRGLEAPKRNLRRRRFFTLMQTRVRGAPARCQIGEGRLPPTFGDLRHHPHRSIEHTIVQPPT